MAGRCARWRFRPTGRKRSPAASTPRRSAGRCRANAAEQVLRFHDGAVNAVAFLQGRPDRHQRRGCAHRDLAAGRAAARDGARRPQGAGGGARGVARWRDARLGVLGPHGAAMAARRRRAARDRRPRAERQRRRLHARRPRAGDRRLRRDAAHLAACAMAVRDRRDDAADAAQYGCGRARRRDRHRRRRRQGLFPLGHGRAARRGRGGADADHRGRAVARRQARSPPPASAARSPSSTAARASSNARWSDPACRSGRPHSFPTAARSSPAAPTA